MTKGTVILIGGVCAALAGQSAHAMASTAPVSAYSAIGGAWLGQVCPCDGDTDGSGFVQIQDILLVVDCVNGFEPAPPLTCATNADVDCDGVVDFCDVSRVYCQFAGMTNCCANTVCGACCNSGANFNDPCLVVSPAFCSSVLIVDGNYLGDGAACDPWPCDPILCSTDADCDDQNPCTTDVCLTDGTCLNESVPNGTACPDNLFCNGDETCQQGVCQLGPPRTCDDGLTCTVDACDEAADTCGHTPAACNNDGVCDSPCESASNCAGDCGACTCVLDQDGSGSIQIQDVLNVVDCAEGRTPAPGLTCENADLDCDGVIDYCDVSRVVCAFNGHPNCCDMEIVCGACCNSGANFNDTCLVISQEFCLSLLIDAGEYLGDGTACDPYPCDATGCTADSDCDDQNVCTDDFCLADGTCVNESVPNGTACPDNLFCNGEELCVQGSCSQFAPLTCDDGLACTADSCDEVADTCVNIAAGCNNDGVCDSPCEFAGNCPGDCGACICVLDQDGSGGLINIVDLLHVADCAEGRTPAPGLTCGDADLDCDGDIDYCDVSRVFCAFVGMANCCEVDMPCGACCNSGDSFGHPCLVVSQPFCEAGLIITDGTYLGDGTVCDPWPCDATPCVTDADCHDGNACTTDTCSSGGLCENMPAPDGAPCSDALFCNGDEACHLGACMAGPPRSCDDLNPCTIDTCDALVDACTHTSIVCNNDGVCDAPCENADNCMSDCSTCSASRDLADGSMAYCPGTVKTVHITLDVPAGALSGAAEDVPPIGWTQISNISDGGEYDAANHKVKWGPLFAPLPAELTYDVVSPVDAVGLMCFAGTTAFDGGPGEPICGDECIEDSCCPSTPADELQAACAGCSDTCSATAGDGRVELCEVIRYACAWKRGCNDDLTGVSGGAYLWMVGECYCWDEAGSSWVAELCGGSATGCCAGAGQGRAASAAGVTGTASVTFDSIRRGLDDRARRLKARRFEISVSIDPPVGTSASALDLQIPKGWVVSVASDGGEWDELHGKVKWGPFFGDLPRTVTVTVNGSLRRVRDHGVIGTVSFDGKNFPVTME